MENRRGDEKARFFTTDGTWENAFVSDREVKIDVIKLHRDSVEWVCAALNAADKREKEGV